MVLNLPVHLCVWLSILLYDEYMQIYIMFLLFLNVSWTMNQNCIMVQHSHLLWYFDKVNLCNNMPLWLKHYGATELAHSPRYNISSKCLPQIGSRVDMFKKQSWHYCICLIVDFHIRRCRGTEAVSLPPTRLPNCRPLSSSQQWMRICKDIWGYCFFFIYGYFSQEVWDHLHPWSSQPKHH